jgi:hypothetical protein
MASRKKRTLEMSRVEGSLRTFERELGPHGDRARF